MVFWTDKGIDLLVGVAATFLSALLAWMVIQRLIPYIRRLIDQDSDPSGSWDATIFTGARTYTYELSLKRRWNNWTGTAAIACREHGSVLYQDAFTLTAFKRDAYVAVTLLGTKSSKASVASGLFMMSDRGRNMDGSWVYRPGIGSATATEELKFARR